VGVKAHMAPCVTLISEWHIDLLLLHISEYINSKFMPEDCLE
jgi:hypothetical protein